MLTRSRLRAASVSTRVSHARRPRVQTGQVAEVTRVSRRCIRHAHVNMPCEVLDVRKQFQDYLGLEQEQPLLLLRIGYGRLMPRSPRRPPAQVLR
jgi:hypothetical protein